MFSKSVEALNIERPVEVLTNGHALRFDPEVMQFCRKEKITQFMPPPVTQLLDQVMLIKKMRFMDILGEILDTWTTKEMLVIAVK